MSKISDLVKRLNDLKVKQDSIDWEEDIPNDIFDEFLKDMDCLEENLDVDKHRWYELSISVYGINDGIFGVRKISDIFSESMCCEDVFYTLEFFEMEEVKIISYKKKVSK